MNEFSEYLFHRLNIKRVRFGKDTFGKDTYTAKDSKEIIAKLTKDSNGNLTEQGKDRIAMLNEGKPVAVIGKGKNAIIARSGKVRAVKFYEKRSPQSERIGANPAEVKSNRETLPKRKERLKSFVNSYRRAFVNSLGVFDDIAKATKSKELS